MALALTPCMALLRAFCGIRHVKIAAVSLYGALTTQSAMFDQIACLPGKQWDVAAVMGLIITC
jgi:hypothetical protein